MCQISLWECHRDVVCSKEGNATKLTEKRVPMSKEKLMFELPVDRVGTYIVFASFRDENGVLVTGEMTVTNDTPLLELPTQLIARLDKDEYNVGTLCTFFAVSAVDVGV